MIIVGTFQPSIEIERALSEIEELGILPEEMMVLYMDEFPPKSNKKKDSADLHVSSFEIGIAFATGLAVIGASVGFKLVVGPIFSGILAAIIGFFSGYCLYYLFHRKKKIGCIQACQKLLYLSKAQKRMPQPLKKYYGGIRHRVLA
ncbi:hypothetical protein A499_04606 [Niallia nealsonii AAU1]|nr:hypothetical protein A499_04606 [Niallia nealsonii AAU1]